MTELKKLSNENLFQLIKDATDEIIERETKEITAEPLKTVKRKAGLGDQFVIVNASDSKGFYKNGDIFTVDSRSLILNGVYAKELVEQTDMLIFDHEYEVLVKENSLLDELEIGDSVMYLGGDFGYEYLNTNGVYEVTGKEVHPTEGIPVVQITDNRQRTTAGAFIRPDTVRYFRKVAKKSANEKRAELLEAVEVFKNSLKTVDGIYAVPSTKNKTTYSCSAEFIHDSEKRTTTCILRGTHSKHTRKRKTARCHPNDVFHERLGELISLCMCLDVEVPEKFLNAVQPDEVVPGMEIYDEALRNISKNRIVVEAGKFPGPDESCQGSISANRGVIINDTNAVYAT